MKAYNGTAWNFVGGEEATTAQVTYNALEYANDNKLMLFALFDGRTSHWCGERLSVNIFEGELGLPIKRSPAVRQNIVAGW